MQTLTDIDIAERLDPATAVAAMRRALIDHARGDLIAPPRIQADLGDGRLTITAGAHLGRWFGFRSYDSLGRNPGSQLVAVMDDTTGEVAGIAVGNLLGPRRVGAIGAVAADLLSAPTAGTVAVIGCGAQAENQLWALRSVRSLQDVRVFSRSPTKRAQFAQKLAARWELPVRAVRSSGEAVRGADIVILATNSPTPVINLDDVASHAYLSTLGPKQQGRAEFDLGLPSSASLLVTDSVAQIEAYSPPNLLHGTAHESRLVELGALLSETEHGKALRTPGRAVFFSVGLAGSEAHLLATLLGLEPADFR